MLPEQVPDFVENYYKYIMKEKKELSEEYQYELKRYIEHLADWLDCYTKPTSENISRRRKLDLGFDTKIEGPLRDSKRFEFLWLVRRSLYELLSSKVLKDSVRYLTAFQLCLVSSIHYKVYSKWLVIEFKESSLKNYHKLFFNKKYKKKK